MKQMLSLLFVFLLVACSSSGKEGRVISAEKATKDKLSEVTVTKIIDKKEEKTIKRELQMESVIQILEYAKPFKASVVLNKPQYVVKAKFKEGFEKTYDIWFNIKEQSGLVRIEDESNNLLVLSKDETDKLLEIFSFSELTGEYGQGQSDLLFRTNFQITKFTMQEEPQTIDYTIAYRLSDALYTALATKTYYLQIIFPPKVQSMLGFKASGVVQGEIMKNDNKEYNLTVHVPVANLTESQRKSITAFPDGYFIALIDDSQHTKGTFPIQVVYRKGQE